MKRVNIALSNELHTKAKILAVLNNITLNEYLDSAIKEKVKKDNKLLKGLK